MLEDVVKEILGEIPEAYRDDVEYIMKKYMFRKEHLANEILHDAVHLLKHIHQDTKARRIQVLEWVGAAMAMGFVVNTDPAAGPVGTFPWKPAWWDASMAITPDAPIPPTPA